MKLYLGNRNYSSWSLRAWVGMRHAGVDFEEEVILLSRGDTKENILKVSPSGHVPVLVDGALVIPESIAILEYVNEVHAGGSLLPEDTGLRALARSASAEMHAGFQNLRKILPMNIRRPPGPFTRPEWAIDPEVRQEIFRVLEMWDGMLRRSEGPWLCGTWSLADAMFLPVASRLHTYTVDLSANPDSAQYVKRALELPAFAEWTAAAEAEGEHLPQYDR